MHHQVFLFDVLHHQVLFQCIGPAFGAGHSNQKQEEHVMNVFLFVWTQWIVLISTPTFVSIAAVITSLKYQWTYKGTLKLSN